MDYFEEIEPYLNDELLPEEKQQFDAELAKNADLRRDVEEYRLLFDLMRGNEAPVYDAEDERLRQVVLKAHGLPTIEQKKTDTTPPKIVSIAPPNITTSGSANRIQQITSGKRIKLNNPVYL